jgi:hypothetical protein
VLSSLSTCGAHARIRDRTRHGREAKRTVRARMAEGRSHSKFREPAQDKNRKGAPHSPEYRCGGSVQSASATFTKQRRQVFVNIRGQPLRGYEHWFDRAVAEAGLRNLVGTVSPYICEQVPPAPKRPTQQNRWLHIKIFVIFEFGARRARSSVGRAMPF